jgi:hypothetical protein
MMVVDRRRWHRTKIGVAVILFLIDLACAGGLEDETGNAPMPSFVGFATFTALLLWLFINIVQEGKRL